MTNMIFLSCSMNVIVFLRRQCNIEQGTLDCWTTTVDAFAYGLSSAMIDYCQLILHLRSLNNETSTVCSHALCICHCRSIHICLCFLFEDIMAYDESRYSQTTDRCLRSSTKCSTTHEKSCRRNHWNTFRTSRTLICSLTIIDK
jgi:hypothetical protein